MFWLNRYLNKNSGRPFVTSRVDTLREMDENPYVRFRFYYFPNPSLDWPIFWQVAGARRMAAGDPALCGWAGLVLIIPAASQSWLGCVWSCWQVDSLKLTLLSEKERLIRTCGPLKAEEHFMVRRPQAQISRSPEFHFQKGNAMLIWYGSTCQCSLLISCAHGSSCRLTSDTFYVLEIEFDLLQIEIRSHSRHVRFEKKVDNCAHGSRNVAKDWYLQIYCSQVSFKNSGSLQNYAAMRIGNLVMMDSVYCGLAGSIHVHMWQMWWIRR